MTDFDIEQIMKEAEEETRRKTEINIQALKDQVSLHNKIIDALTEAKQLLIKEFEQGYRVKNDKTFYAKDEERFNEVLKLVCEKHSLDLMNYARIDLALEGGTWHLDIRDGYVSDYYSGFGEDGKRPQYSYHQLRLVIWSEDMQQPTEHCRLNEKVTYDEVVEAQAEVTRIEKEIEALKEQKENTLTGIRNFKRIA